MDPISPSVNQTNEVQSTLQSKSNSILNGSVSNEGATSSKSTHDPIKRKHLQPKSIPNISHQTLDKSLDEWLENCMRDSTYMNSSTEFLDKNMSTSSANQYRNYPNNIPYTMRPSTGMPDTNRYYPIFSYADQFGGGPSGLSSNPHQMLHNNVSGFTSLPPAVNMISQEQKSGSQDLLDTLENRRYRFSDPCLAANSDSDSKDGGPQLFQNQNESSIKNNDSNNLLTTLLQQINILHDTNVKICRNLQDTKVDIEALKHAPNWGLRHRRDSISGLSTHSQPLGGYAFGTHSPASTFHSGMYTPGLMTDVVREVKEAARVREEALLSRVKSMVEERSWTINDTNLKLIRDMEEMKIQINQFKLERHETNTRITKMEEEIKSLRTLLSHVLNITRPNTFAVSPQSYDSERDFMRPLNRTNSNENNRKHRHSLNLNYGTVVSNDNTLAYPNENEILRPMNQQFNEIRKAEKFKYSQTNGKHNMSCYPTDNHNGIGRPFETDGNVYTTPENEQNEGHIVQMEKETLELRRELQEALANQKHAEKKAQALENLVKNLQNQKSNEPSNASANQSSTISSRNSSISETNSVISQGKPQLASQIQTISPKLLSSNISLTGPVTDL